MTKMIEILAERGPLSKYNLMFAAGLSTKQFERLFPAMMDIYSTTLEYNNSTKELKYIGKGFINKPIIDESENIPQEQEIPIENESIPQDEEVQTVDY